MVRRWLADVLRLSFLVLASVKALDVELDHGSTWGLAWLAVILLAARFRPALVLLAAGALLGWVTGGEAMTSTHAVLIAWVAVILAFGDHGERLLLLRTQVVALYLFATLNKLNGAYLAGDAIALRTTDLPLVPAAVCGILAEGWLAWAVWTRSRWAFPVAVVTHAGIVAVMGRDPYEWTLLASYNGIVVLLVWWVTRSEPSHRVVGGHLCRGQRVAVDRDQTQPAVQHVVRAVVPADLRHRP